MDRLEAKLDTFRDATQTSFAALRTDLHTSNAALRDKIASAQIWALVLYFALAAGMLGAMGRGFGWI
jgi:hypothetical protein